MSAAVDGWRLALGTFTAIPTSPPEAVDSRRMALSLLFSPLAFGLWAIGAGIVLALGLKIGVEPLPIATLGVLLLVLGNRAFHLDGLADTADALASSYDRERSLDVARLGNVGPAGVAAIVLVLVLQISAASALLEHQHGVWVFVALAALARLAATTGATRGVPAARTEGLGASIAESLPRWVTLIVWFALITAIWGLSIAIDFGSPVPVYGALLAGVVVAALVRRCIGRLGGIIGDALGASVEIAFAVFLLGFAI